jgi:CzcA family heavy metal efflux pump
LRLPKDSTDKVKARAIQARICGPIGRDVVPGATAQNSKIAAARNSFLSTCGYLPEKAKRTLSPGRRVYPDLGLPPENVNNIQWTPTWRHFVLSGDMRWLVGLCLAYRGTVALLMVLALAMGGLIASRAPVDVFPEFVPPTVSIQTEAPGFEAQQVEQLVTRLLENAVNGAQGITTMRSESIPGLSVITITFREGIDLYQARQGISERIFSLGSILPSGVKEPKLSPLVSSTKDLLMIGLVSDKVDAYTLRDRAAWLIKPALLGVPGVANVLTYGGAVREIEIEPDLAVLAAFGFKESELIDAAKAALVLRGFGFIDLKAQRLLLQSPTPSPDLKAIGDAVLTVRSKTPITLRQVAQIKEVPALRFGDATIMGKPGVMLWVAGQYGANTLKTTQAIEAELAILTPALTAEGIHVYPRLQRTATFIERALSNLQNAVVIAGILILAVLYIFLRDWRSALISFVAIPLSLVAAISVLDWRGYTLNTMTLGGVAVSLGVLVDDAIIDIENILRRLRENNFLAAPTPRLAVILDASIEVRAPVVYATIIAIAVFLPELFASNVQGHFIGPLAVAFILAVFASLIVALTATPVLCALLLREKEDHREPRWLARLKTLQARVILLITQRLWLAIGGLAALFGVSLAVLPFLGSTLMPDFKEGHFVLYVNSAPGISLNELLGVGKRITHDVLQLPYVATVEQHAGRAELSEDTYGTNSSEMHVELKPDADIDQDEAEDQLRGILARYPGLQTEVVTFLGDRISDSITGEKAQIAMKIYGDDLSAIDEVADNIIRTIRSVQGVKDLQFARQSDTPELGIHPLESAMTANGLSTADLLNTAEASFEGIAVGQTYSGVRLVNVVLRLPDQSRDRLEDLGSLLIPGPFGPVPLNSVANIVRSSGRYSIRHDAGRRLVSVTFNVAGRSVQSTVAEATAKIQNAGIVPKGMYLDVSGAAAAEQQARKELVLYSALALAVIVMVLFTCFQWPANAWLVLANVPFSLIGGILAIAVTGIGLTLGALVGLVTVFGVSARNSILLLAHYEHLVLHEGLPWDLTTVLRGAQERLIPIMTTAAVTALGLLPLAIAMAKPGQEIEGPMAITVLGGLLVSTLLNLILLPALAKRFSHRIAGI